jgi:hypothetical protein
VERQLQFKHVFEVLAGPSDRRWKSYTMGSMLLFEWGSFGAVITSVDASNEPR